MNDEELHSVADLYRQIEDLKRENDRLTEILGLKSSRNLERPHANQSGSLELESPLSSIALRHQSRKLRFSNRFLSVVTMFMRCDGRAHERESTVGHLRWREALPTLDRRTKSI